MDDLYSIIFTTISRPEEAAEITQMQLVYLIREII
jgi:hypothetical protein